LCVQIIIILLYFITVTGHHRPELRQLNRYVLQVCHMWQDIGIQLLDPRHVQEVQLLRTSREDQRTCCMLMFQLWLDRQPSATWSDLLQALREPHIGLNFVASTIEEEILQPLTTVSEGTYAE